MNESRLHIVFIHPGAIDALGEAIKPYLSEGPYGKHIICREIDAGGPFFVMTIEGTTGDGRSIELQVMLPANMVQMVVSTQGEGTFGFQPGKPPLEDAVSRHSVAAVAPAQPATAGKPATGSDTAPVVEG